ncbi:MAG TPA: helix-turn-helix transcriptional regulator [Mycobacteriales bacterium]|nr:helix-turn-helix transcriptional regulator [Mycobacteriales bacterium]
MTFIDAADAARHFSDILRQARRDADFSQRELCRWSGIPRATVARAELSPASVRFGVVLALLRTCGYDLEITDRSGSTLPPFLVEDRRDRAGRHYPAHLDVRETEWLGDWWGDQWPGAWGVPPRPDHTFDLSRAARDARRERDHVPRQRRVA